MFHCPGKGEIKHSNVLRPSKLTYLTRVKTMVALLCVKTMMDIESLRYCVLQGKYWVFVMAFHSFARTMSVRHWSLDKHNRESIVLSS